MAAMAAACPVQSSTSFPPSEAHLQGYEGLGGSRLSWTCRRHLSADPASRKAGEGAAGRSPTHSQGQDHLPLQLHRTALQRLDWYALTWELS